MSSTTLQISSKLESFLQGTKKLYINGQFVTSHDNKTFSTPNLTTGETLIDVYEAGAKDIDEAVKAAKKAFHGPWRSMSAAERARLMFKLADLMEENLEELAQLETLDNGKPINETTNADIPLAIEHMRYYAGYGQPK